MLIPWATYVSTILSYPRANNVNTMTDYAPSELGRYDDWLLPCSVVVSSSPVHNILVPEQNGRRLADDNFKYTRLNENICIFIQISFELLGRGLIDNMPTSLSYWLGTEHVTIHCLNLFIQLNVLNNSFPINQDEKTRSWKTHSTQPWVFSAFNACHNQMKVLIMINIRDYFSRMWKMVCADPRLIPSQWLHITRNDNCRAACAVWFLSHGRHCHSVHVRVIECMFALKVPIIRQDLSSKCIKTFPAKLRYLSKCRLHRIDWPDVSL